MKTNTIQTIKKATMRLAALVAAIAAPSAYAANGTWLNTPTDANWVNTLNWVGGVVPGTINNTANNGVDGSSVAFFTNAITTFGGAANPVTPDDATVVNGKARMMSRVVFDGANCGAYVFNSLSPYAAQTASTPETGVMSLCIPSSAVTVNGSYITATVTNPQTFLVPVQIRLPSSTTGTYGFTNDATSANATYYFQRLFLYPGATGRGVTYVFTGSNTGTNTVALLQQSANQTGSPTGVRKTGTGRWILSGANTFNNGSAMNIDQGTLEVLDPGAFGAVTTTINVNTNGILQINGVTLNAFSLALKNSGTVRMNGTADINGINVNNGTGNTPTITTTSGSDVCSVGTGISLNSVVAGGAADSVLNTAGPGTLVFAQANTYIGKWSFNAKTNMINGSSALGTGANANVGSGAIFDFSVQGAVSFVPTTAGFGGSGAGSSVGSTAAAVIGDAGATLDLSTKAINLTFTPTSFSGDTTHPALTMAQGTLAIGGNTFFINNASGTPLGVGTYRLIEQTSGSIVSGGGYAALISGSGMVGGAAAAIVVTGGNVDLVISIYVPKNLVWSGTGALWDIATTSDWLDGVIASVFNNSDIVTFNGTGIANPSVTLVGTLAPATAVVDTSSGDYTFGGAGQIAGTTSLTKIGAGTLNLNTVNTYAGGTVVSNGTVKIGANNAVSSTGSGDVAVYGSSVVDLNGFNNTVNALLGNGNVDNASGGASVLTVGGNDDSGTFSGVIKNTSGTLGVTKIGTGQVTLSGANTYVGPTVVSGGTLEVQNVNALGASAVAVNSGLLRTTTSLNVNTLTGADGTSIANSAGAGANTITHTGVGNYTGIISDGASGSIGIYIPSGTLQLNGNNTYSGNTIIASGATLAIGVRNPGGSGNAGTGGITASNSAIISMPPNVSTSVQVPNAITNVDASGTVYFPSSGQANSHNGQFYGGANNTNIFSGPMTIGGNLSFANFLGTAIISNGASVRFFTGIGIDAGGDNTTFIVEGFLFNRDPRIARLGALMGSNGSLSGPSNPGNPTSTFMIGAKGVTTTFSGFVSGSNNIVKVGVANLTFNGVTATAVTNLVTMPDPFEPTNIVEFAYTTNVARVTYTGNTVVSNGTLKVVAPNNLTNSSSITLAGGTLDASMIGYATNQTMIDYNLVEQVTNTVIVTTGVVEVPPGKSLNGQGSLLGSVVTDAASTMNVGNPIGTMAISGSIALNGTVNMDLNRTNAPNNSDRITAASFSGSGATLNVTDAGPALFTGTVCQLFSGPVTAFTTVNLPATNGATTYLWTNKIAFNGTIELLSGASPVDPNPTNITSAVTGGGTTLTLSWPSGHTGWTLQTQTNAINVGISGTWFDVAGSAATNQVILPINPANPTVFYRLKL